MSRTGKRIELLDHGRNAWRDPGKPRRYRTDPTCKAKRRFTDEVMAHVHAVLSIEEEKNRIVLYYYRCAHCDGWHLTHKRQSNPEHRVMVIPR